MDVVVNVIVGCAVMAVAVLVVVFVIVIVRGVGCAVMSVSVFVTVLVSGVQCAACAAAPLLACAVLVASHYPYRHAPVEILAVPVLASDNFRRTLPATLAAVLFASRLRDLLHTSFPPLSGVLEAPSPCFELLFCEPQ